MEAQSRVTNDQQRWNQGNNFVIAKPKVFSILIVGHDCFLRINVVLLLELKG